MVISCNLRVAFGELLIIQSSDNHSKYKRIEKFLVSSHEIISEFKKKYPKGEVIFVFNGDYSGASSFANHRQDRGQLGLEVMATLAQKYKVLFTFGNHEAFDWLAEGDANELLHKQLKYLHQNGVINLVSNITTRNRTQNYITGHFDYISRVGKKIRFQGLQLETFFEKVASFNGHGPDEVLEVDSYLESAKKLIGRAKRDEVDSLVFAYHEGFTKVVKATEDILEYIPRKMKMPVAFAAHDHLVKDTFIEKTFVIDSGSNFDFSAVVLSDKGKLISHKFFDKKAQIDLAAKGKGVPKYLRSTVKKLTSHINELLDLSSEGLKTIPEISENKLTLKKQRSNVLGNSLGDSLREFGLSKIQDKELPPVKEVIGMFNSSSYRNDSNLDEGILSETDIREMAPIKNNVTIHRLTGQEVQIFFEGLRRFREREEIYSPQMSANIRESDNYQLLIRNKRASWKPLKFDKEYYLVLDNWLAINGYHIPEHDKLALESKIVGSMDQYEVLSKYIHNALRENFFREMSCHEGMMSILSINPKKKIRPSLAMYTIYWCSINLHETKVIDEVY